MMNLARFAASTPGADKKRALRAVLRGAKKIPAGTPLLAAQAALEESMGDRDAALATIERALKILPNHPWYLARQQQLSRQ